MSKYRFIVGFSLLLPFFIACSKIVSTMDQNTTATTNDRYEANPSLQKISIPPSGEAIKITGKVKHFLGHVESSGDVIESKVIQSENGNYVQIVRGQVSEENWKQIPNDYVIQAELRQRQNQIEIKILSLKKTTNENFTIFRKSGSEPLAFNQFRIAFVYLRFSDTSHDGIDSGLPTSVKEIFRSGTFNRILPNSDETDIFEAQINESYKGCSNYYEYGSFANNWIKNNSSKYYERIVTVLPSKKVGATCGWVGITQGGWNRFRTDSPVIASVLPLHTVIAHEIGHTLGLGHSSALNKGTYGDKLDFMGNKGSLINLAKLVDLKVLGENGEIKKVEERTEDIQVRNRHLWNFSDPLPIGINKGNIFISYWGNLGVLIHSRSGEECCGVTSLELAKLSPGQSWLSSEGYKIHFRNQNSDYSAALITYESNKSSQASLPPVATVDPLPPAKALPDIPPPQPPKDLSPPSEEKNTISSFCQVQMKNAQSLSEKKESFLEIESKDVTTIYHEQFEEKIINGVRSIAYKPLIPIRNVMGENVLNTKDRPYSVGLLAAGSYSFNVYGDLPDGTRIKCNPQVVSFVVNK